MLSSSTIACGPTSPTSALELGLDSRLGVIGPSSTSSASIPFDPPDPPPPTASTLHLYRRASAPRSARRAIAAPTAAPYRAPPASPPTSSSDPTSQSAQGRYLRRSPPEIAPCGALITRVSRTFGLMTATRAAEQAWSEGEDWHAPLRSPGYRPAVPTSEGWPLSAATSARQLSRISRPSPSVWSSTTSGTRMRITLSYRPALITSSPRS